MTVPDELRHELWAAFTNGEDVDGWHFDGAEDDHWTAGVDRMIPILREALANEVRRKVLGFSSEDWGEIYTRFKVAPVLLGNNARQAVLAAFLVGANRAAKVVQGEAQDD